jgi:hypothetical protein
MPTIGVIRDFVADFIVPPTVCPFQTMQPGRPRWLFLYVPDQAEWDRSRIDSHLVMQEIETRAMMQIRTIIVIQKCTHTHKETVGIQST